MNNYPDDIGKYRTVTDDPRSPFYDSTEDDMRREEEEERVEQTLNNHEKFSDAVGDSYGSDASVELYYHLIRLYHSVKNPVELSGQIPTDEAIEDLKQAMETIARDYG